MSDLKGKRIAIVAMGQSQIDFHLSQIHSVKFDEIWAINAMIGILPKVDKAFILDPMSRFLDTDNAGNMTEMMRNLLPEIDYPIYTCELDDRVPSAKEYPLEKIVEDTGCSYFNNTIAYAIAYAYWSKVSEINIFGVDFTYKGNLHFAEMGRACCEFWLAKCTDKGINIGIAPHSSLLDTNIEPERKLYGYHRLDDPLVTYYQDNKMKVCRLSEIEKEENKPVGVIGRDDLQFHEVPEPNKY